jgi:hypothetical protein
MVVLSGPNEKANEKAIHLDKNQYKQRRERGISPIDVIHSIEEDCSGAPWIHDNAVNGYMPIFVERVMLINVPRPRCQTMVPLPDEEHLASKVGKVGVISEH